MISAHLLLMFIIALIIVCALPGADMALVMQTSMSRGTRSGFAAACGLGLARATHVTLSACGLAALLRNAPWLYEAVRYVGAAYLTPAPDTSCGWPGERCALKAPCGHRGASPTTARRASTGWGCSRTC